MDSCLRPKKQNPGAAATATRVSDSLVGTNVDLRAHDSAVSAQAQSNDPLCTIESALSSSIAFEIGEARFGQVDDIMRRIWDYHSRALLSDDDASRLDAAARTARGDVVRNGRSLAAALPKAHRRPRHRVSPERARAIQHRRELGGCGAFPRKIAGGFPTAQQAVLTIIAHEVRAKGDCRLHVKEIEDRAKVCRRTVQNTIREAQRLGLVTVQARRLSRTKSMPNIIRIVSPEWRAWLKLDAGTARYFGGVQSSSSAHESQHLRYQYKQERAFEESYGSRHRSTGQLQDGGAGSKAGIRGGPMATVIGTRSSSG
jgi:hypothetical protein